MASAAPHTLSHSRKDKPRESPNDRGKASLKRYLLPGPYSSKPFLFDFCPKTSLMADPLSIAASLAGLLSVAGKISSVVIDFISSINDVPASARAALQTVEEMRVTLSSAKLLMDQLSQMPRERKEMIHVRHLVIIFRESILSMSDLEAIVCLADDGEKASKWDRVKWLLEETKVLRAVERIGAHQSSLSTMLNILQW